MWRDTDLTEQVEKRQNTLFHIFFHTLSQEKICQGGFHQSGTPPLTTQQKRRARLSTAPLKAPFIFTVDWFG